jgi:branched-chain amino acid transport system substrate-binding protein
MSSTRKMLSVGVSTAAMLVVAQAFAAEPPVKVGVPLPLSGSLAEAGHKMDRGFEMCREAVTQKGGIQVSGKKRPLEFVKYDYQSDTNRALQLVQRLVTTDKVEFLFAPYGSGDTKAAAVLAERYEIPMIATGAATESIFDQGFKNIFGILFPNRAISQAEVNFYKKAYPDLKRVATLSMNSLYPKSLAADMKREAESAGLSVVFEGVFPPGTLDFSSVLTQIAQQKPDWIFVTGYTQSNVQVRKQMAELKVGAPIITMTLGPAYPEFVENLRGLAEGVTTDTWWHTTASYQDTYMFGSAQAYGKEFQKKHGYQPADVEGAASVACEVLVQAIEAAGSTDTAAVRKVFAAKQFDTFFGPIQFGPGGQNMISKPLLLQIRDGKAAIIAPAEMKQIEFAKSVPGN